MLPTIRHARNGFTLIELLITISIVALLVAISLPFLAGARKNAWDVKCLSNMRQVTTALHAASADRAGQFPVNRTAMPSDLTGVANAPTHRTWRATLVNADYLPGNVSGYGPLVGEPPRAGGQGAETAETDDSIWVCAVAPEKALREKLDGKSICREDVGSHYTYNGEIAWKNYPLPADAEDRELVNVTNAGETAVLIETRAWWPDLRLSSIRGRGRFPGAEQDGWGYFGFWHTGDQGNWAFHDGSARPMALRDSFHPTNYWGKVPEGVESTKDIRYWMAEKYR